MKKLAIYLFVLCTINAFSQDTKNDSLTFNKTWNFTLGFNMVDNRGSDKLFSGLSYTEENAFSKLPITAALERRMSKWFGVEARASVNSWDAQTGVIDGQNLSSKEGYYAIDISAKIYLDEAFKFTSEIEWLDFYAMGGFGYFTINDGSFTTNYGMGSSIWFSKRVGLDFNVFLKSTSNSNPLETNHFLYTMGLVVKLPNKKQALKEIIEEEVVVIDSDGDSTPDELDECPNTPGFADNKGCPYFDSDKDGVIDKADYCPQIAGLPENNGCPAKKEVIKVVEMVKEPAEDLVTVAKKIKFESGNYNFTQDTYPSLIDLAKLLIQEPKNIKFKIIGHTDSVGDYKINRELSLRRASAVRNYLVDSGIAKDRIAVVGLGESDPIDNNLTKEGRANNRRVEIIILK